MNQPPVGTVTFLFTDIEGSTRLWQQYPGAMPVALNRHHALLNEAIAAHGGYVFQIVGDAFCAAFATANDGLDAALAAQRALAAEMWDETGALRVRMALHTGSAHMRAGDYISGEYASGLTLSRAARLLSAGHGGQILLSMPVNELVRDNLPAGVTLRDMGPKRLKDLIRPEHIFQVVAPDLLADFPALKTLDSLPNNLPMHLTSFVGREKEIGEITEILRHARLVTLTGAGGSGKTRLALQVAAELIEEFADGVWVVDLASLADPSFVLQAIAEVLSVRQESGRPLTDLLADYVRRRELLLLLDNCEHLVEACARAADFILRAGPGVKMVATSREGLGIAGERAYVVPPLSTPDARLLPAPESLSQYEAVRLFIDRARAVRVGFAVTNANAASVAQICHQLDGIPLAIELAAARVQAMSPEQIAARLDHMFRLLTGGSRTAIPRHQTLRAAIDWSWGLLSENERTLLARLSVFAGGWTLEAAEEIGIGEGIEEGAVLDLLTHLVSKSLVVWEERQGEPRYRLLETIRQHAHERLGESGEEGRVRRCHAEFYARWTEETTSQVYNALQATWVKRLDLEQDNLRTALEWAVNLQPGIALRIANALADYYWVLRSAYTEAVRWYERALPNALDAPVEVRCCALANVALCALQLGRTTRYAEESLSLARQSNDRSLLALALGALGEVKQESGDLPGAAACFEEALPLAQSPSVETWLLTDVGFVRVAAGDYDQAEILFQRAADVASASYVLPNLAQGLWDLAHLALLRGDIGKARADLTEALRVACEIRSVGRIAHTRETLGRVQIQEGAFDDARALLSQALTMLQDLGMKSCIAHNLDSWASLAVAQGDARRAAQLLGALTAHLNRLGMSMIPLQHALHKQTLAAVEQQLGPTIFHVEWRAGEKLNLEQAIALATKWQ